MMRAAVTGGRYVLPVTCLVLGLSVSGCIRPSVPLPQSYRQPWVAFFVAHTPGDELAMEEQISTELRNRGLHASSGPFEGMAPDADVLVIYEQRWWQNILVRIEVLDLQLRDARTGVTLAAGSSRAAAVIGHRPATLVGDAVSELLGSAID